MKYQADELSRDEDVLAVLHSPLVNYNVYKFKFYISLSFEISQDTVFLLCCSETPEIKES